MIATQYGTLKKRIWQRKVGKLNSKFSISRKSAKVDSPFARSADSPFTRLMNSFREILKKRLGLKSIDPSAAFLHSSPAPNVLKSGQILKLARTFSDAEVADYSKLSLDSNPLHFDYECAKMAGFTDRLVPGMLVATLFPKIIASHFPGAVYASQTLQFKLPVYIGEEIIGTVEATSIKEMKKKYVAKFTTKCLKDGNTLVIHGEATAILPNIAMEKQ